MTWIKTLEGVYVNSDLVQSVSPTNIGVTYIQFDYWCRVETKESPDDFMQRLRAEVPDPIDRVL